MDLPTLPEAPRGSSPLLRRVGVRWLLTGLVVAGCAWAFVVIANAVSGPGLSFDRRLLEMFVDPAEPGRQLRPPWIAGAARDITSLGSWTVLSLIVGVVSLGLIAAGQRRQALLVLAACSSGLMLSAVLKAVFLRARPEVAFRATEVWSTSFPSGHSMNAAVVYLTLAALVAQSQKRRRSAVFALTTGAGLAVLVGASRVYLGVHWPTDVLAGWAAGFGWAAAWWLVADRVRARHSAEKRPA